MMHDESWHVRLGLLNGVQDKIGLLAIGAVRPNTSGDCDDDIKSAGTKHCDTKKARPTLGQELHVMRHFLDRVATSWIVRRVLRRVRHAPERLVQPRVERKVREIRRVIGACAERACASTGDGSRR